tara:strand:+ start:544 stop:936 length:393 start_codon:yes stop_codon:yes gene_type:complete
VYEEVSESDGDAIADLWDGRAFHAILMSLYLNESDSNAEKVLATIGLEKNEDAVKGLKIIYESGELLFLKEAAFPLIAKKDDKERDIFQKGIEEGVQLARRERLLTEELHRLTLSWNDAPSVLQDTIPEV